MLKHMKAHSHLKPGQNGTHRLVARFGDSLICVRYRYDEIRDVRLTTAEIIVDEKPGKAAPRLRETDYARSLSDLGNRRRKFGWARPDFVDFEVNSCSIDQESGGIWAVQTDLQ